jgi:hypothetical protein
MVCFALWCCFGRFRWYGIQYFSWHAD